MTKINQTSHFTGKTIYVGMDVHLKNWNITLYSEQQYLRKFQQEANPQTLVKHLADHYPGAHFKLAYEALLWLLDTTRFNAGRNGMYRCQCC